MAIGVAKFTEANICFYSISSLCVSYPRHPLQYWVTNLSNEKSARLWICEPWAQARYQDTIFILWCTVISSIYSEDQRNLFSTRDFIWSLNTNMCPVRMSYILLYKYSEINVRLISLLFAVNYTKVKQFLLVLMAVLKFKLVT